MDIKELTTLTNKRIANLTFSEFRFAVDAMDDDVQFKEDFLYEARNRNFEAMGRVMSMWISITHEADIRLNDGL